MIGAPQPLVLAKPAAIDTAQAARYFGARGEPDDRTMTLLETCAMPLLAAATPRAVWLEADTAALAEAGILRGACFQQRHGFFVRLTAGTKISCGLCRINGCRFCQRQRPWSTDHPPHLPAFLK